MQLVFDIGNSAVKAGLFSGSMVDHTFRSTHDPASLRSTILAELHGKNVDSAAISSVVPRTTELVSNILGERGISVSVIRHDMFLPFQLDYETPRTLGADRLAAAAAVWLRYGEGKDRGVVALDAGTAFTYEVVDRSGVYRGGTIAPGPSLMQRALNRDTAQLPEVPLEMPASVIGRSTVEAIQVGIMYGFIESVRGILRRINEELGETAYVAATGGWSTLLSEHVAEINTIDPHLVLDGVRLLAELNRDGSTKPRTPNPEL